MNNEAIVFLAQSPWLFAALAVAMTIVALMAFRGRRIMARQLRAAEAERERLLDRNQVLAASEARYRSLAEVRSEFILRCNAEGYVTYANEALAQLIGVPRKALEGTHAKLPVKESLPPRLTAAGTQQIDEALEIADGSLRWISWEETEIETPRGRESQRIGRDVTERVTAERALEEGRRKAEAANEAKSRFLATVSHEIRTPLNGILGMADLLGETQLDPEQATYVRAIRTSGDVLLSLIDEILDFSKIEAGKLELSQEPFNLRLLVESVVELLAPRAQGKGVEIAALIDEAVPTEVVGDADRLRQVLMNLAGNAVKFTEAGGVGIRVETMAAGALRFSVEDTGPGIPAARLEDIFGEFEQADEPTSRRHGGTGLGLAISRRISDRMGGRIAVESEVGRGSTFKLELNLPVVQAATDSEPIHRPDLTGRQILIAAQSPFEAPFLAAQLKKAGALLTLAASEDEAGRAMAHGVDIVLIDCALGDEAARRLAIAARNAGASRTIVLLSPFERRDFGLPSAAGFNGFLIKPVRSRSLFQQIEGWTGPVEQGGSPVFAAERVLARLEATVASARVLLAEDNEINALLTLKALEHFGAKVDWARDGRRALAFAKGAIAGRAPTYDLVLLDVRMPELDGLEVVRQIRVTEDEAGKDQRLRVVMLTANAFAEDRMAAHDAGADGFLAKPLDRAKLRSWLPQAEQREAV
jgi:PAS domain S-box-containing protein